MVWYLDRDTMPMGLLGVWRCKGLISQYFASIKHDSINIEREIAETEYGITDIDFLIY